MLLLAAIKHYPDVDENTYLSSYIRNVRTLFSKNSFEWLYVNILTYWRLNAWCAP